MTDLVPNALPIGPHATRPTPDAGKDEDVSGYAQLFAEKNRALSQMRRQYHALSVATREAMHFMAKAERLAGMAAGTTPTAPAPPPPTAPAPSGGARTWWRVGSDTAMTRSQSLHLTATHETRHRLHAGPDAPTPPPCPHGGSHEEVFPVSARVLAYIRFACRYLEKAQEVSTAPSVHETHLPTTTTTMVVAPEGFEMDMALGEDETTEPSLYTPRSASSMSMEHGLPLHRPPTATRHAGSSADKATQTHGHDAPPHHPDAAASPSTPTGLATSDDIDQLAKASCAGCLVLRDVCKAFRDAQQHLKTVLQAIQQELAEAVDARKRSDMARAIVEGEIEELTATLFDQANTMVVAEAKRVDQLTVHNRKMQEKLDEHLSSAVMRDEELRGLKKKLESLHQYRHSSRGSPGTAGMSVSRASRAASDLGGSVGTLQVSSHRFLQGHMYAQVRIDRAHSQDGSSVNKLSCPSILTGSQGNGIGDNRSFGQSMRSVGDSDRSLNQVISVERVYIDGHLLDEFVSHFQHLSSLNNMGKQVWMGQASQSEFIKSVLTYDVDPCLQPCTWQLFSKKRLMNAISRNAVCIETNTTAFASTSTSEATANTLSTTPTMKSKKATTTPSTCNIMGKKMKCGFCCISRECEFRLRIDDTLLVDTDLKRSASGTNQGSGLSLSALFSFNRVSSPRTNARATSRSKNATEEGTPVNWSPLCRFCRDRLVAVCEFFRFLSNLNAGLVNSQILDLYRECIYHRRNMCVARLGASGLFYKEDLSNVVIMK